MDIPSAEAEKRYKALLLSFRIANTLELSDGRCACISCQKLFRSMKYLNMHFERIHALELQELESRSRVPSSSKQNLYIPRHQKLSYKHDSKRDVILEEDTKDEMTATQRAERQIYLDLDNTKED